MRKLLIILATGFSALGMAGVATAAPINWSGTARVLWADHPEGVITGGGVATINGSAGVIPAHLSTLRLAESRGNIGGTFTQFVTDPYAVGNQIAAWIWEIDGVGSPRGTWGQISGGAASTSMGAGAVPVRGLVKVCLFSTACTWYFPLVLNQSTTVNGVPTGTRGVGIGGLITAHGHGGIRISLQAAPWTIKTATVADQITVTWQGEPVRIISTWWAGAWAHAPVSTTTSTAQPSGMVQLLTPNQVTTNLPLGSNYLMGSMVITVIHFIPEPGLVLLLGSGVAGLALLGRKRLRK